MASLWDVIDRVEQVLQKPTIQRARARGMGPEVGKLSFRPNPPKMVTLILALVLTVVGLSVSETVTIGFVNDLLGQLDWTFTRDQGYWMLLGSPALLILGSLLPGL